MIVLACNTATAVVWEEVKEALDIPVLGVILPGASAAIKATKSKRIGVIGTPMTVASDIYRKKNSKPITRNGSREFSLSEICPSG